MNSSQTNAGFPMQGRPPVPAVFGFANLHPQASSFNDYTTVKADEMRGGFKKIRRIVGYYHEKNVIGLEFIYELSTGQTVMTSHNIPHENFLKKMVGTVTGKNVVSYALDVQEGDYIEAVQACFNEKKVIYLGFATYRGTKVAFGFQKGDCVTISNPGYTFGPAKGGYEKERLNYIVFPAATIPENITGQGYNMSHVARPITPNVRPLSPVGGRPLSPNSMSRTTITETSVTGVSGIMVGAPPIPPISGSQLRQLDMKISRMNNSSMSSAEMQQQLLMQQQQVGAQLQQQQAQIQIQLQQIQQQQQIDIRSQMERQQLMRLQEMELERSRERQVILHQRQQLERMMMMHNVDQQQVVVQQQRLQALLRVQSDRERIHQAQIAEMKALQVRQAQELEMVRTQQIQVHDGGVDILKRQLEEQQQLEKKHKLDMMRQLEQQLNEQKTLEFRQSAIKPTGDITVSATSATSVYNSGSRTLLQSNVRPVSPNTLAPPGQVPVPQVIQHQGFNNYPNDYQQGGQQGYNQPPTLGYPQQGQYPPQQSQYPPQQGLYQPQGPYPPQQQMYQQPPYNQQGWQAQQGQQGYQGPPPQLSVGQPQPPYQGGTQANWNQPQNNSWQQQSQNSSSGPTNPP